MGIPIDVVIGRLQEAFAAGYGRTGKASQQVVAMGWSQLRIVMGSRNRFWQMGIFIRFVVAKAEFHKEHHRDAEPKVVWKP